VLELHHSIPKLSSCAFTKREKVIDRIKLIIRGRFEFNVNDIQYVQPILYSLAVNRQPGYPISVNLILHPFISYGLVEYGLLYKSCVLKDFYNLINDFYRSHDKERGFDFTYFSFLNILLAVFFSL
jgi:hypothetical protein